MPEALVETAIGLFFVFILMSMAASQIIEWIASIRRWRAKDLEKTIRIMLSDPANQKNIDKEALILTDKLYEHPLIASLGQPGRKPSYIPAGKFALALFDVIVTAGTDVSTIGRAGVGLEQLKNHMLSTLPATADAELISLIAQIQKLMDEATANGLDPVKVATFYLPPLLNDELNGFLKRYNIPAATFNALIKALMADSNFEMSQVLTGVVQLAKNRPQLSQLLSSLFSSLEGSMGAADTRLAVARRNVEEWFDDAMDRAGGGYKRHTQVWLGCIGFLMALLLNVDTINISAALWRDPTLRQNVVEQVQNYKLDSTIDGTAITTPEEAAQTIRALNQTLSQDLGLPIGWHTGVYSLKKGETCVWLPQRQGDTWGIPSKAGCLKIEDAYPGQRSGLLGKLLGLLITAAAISQGAPFWFDLLSKVGNIRSSGAVPATSAEKAAEKAKERGMQKVPGDNVRALP